MKTFRNDRVQGTACFVHMTSRGYKPVNPELNYPLELAVYAF